MLGHIVVLVARPQASPGHVHFVYLAVHVSLLISDFALGILLILLGSLGLDLLEVCRWAQDLKDGLDMVHVLRAELFQVDLLGLLANIETFLDPG